MKYIPKFEWGGVYSPLQPQMPAQSTAPATRQPKETTQKDPKTPMRDAIMGMLPKDNMLTSDYNKLMRKYEGFLTTLMVSGEEADPAAAMAFLRDARTYINNYDHHKKADEAMKTADSYGDIAVDSGGRIFAQDKETHQLVKVTSDELYNNPDKYQALTNNGLAELRSEEISDDTSMTSAIQQSVSITTIRDNLEKATKSITPDSLTLGGIDGTSPYGRAVLEGRNIANELIMNKEYQLKVEDRPKLDEYLTYMWQNAMSGRDRQQVKATAAACGYDPNDPTACMRMLLGTYNLYTKNIQEATTKGSDPTKGSGSGGGDGISGVFDLDYTARFATSDSIETQYQQYVKGSNTLLTLSGHKFQMNKQGGNDDERIKSSYITLDKALQEVAGVADMADAGKYVMFGGKPINKQQMERSIMLDVQSGIMRSDLPYTTFEGSIVPDFEILDSIALANKELSEGALPATIYEKYFKNSGGKVMMPSAQNPAFAINPSFIRPFAIMEGIVNSRYVGKDVVDDPSLEKIDKGEGGRSMNDIYRDVVKSGTSDSGAKSDAMDPGKRLFRGDMYEGKVYVALDPSQMSNYVPDWQPKADFTNTPERMVRSRQTLVGTTF